MPPIRPRRQTEDPTKHWLLTDDGSQTLWDSRLDETYHSGCGAVSECLAVYLINSRVAERLISGVSTQVVEYGFGTGTSFLLTAALASACQTPLTYVGLERDLLPSKIMADIGVVKAVRQLWPQSPLTRDFPIGFVSELSRLHQKLIEFWEQLECPPVSVRRLQLDANVGLQLLIRDARDAIRDDMQELVGAFHAAYFDAFAPEKDPGLWNLDVFRTTFRLLQPGGTLTTYCVKSQVRRLLEEVGFQIEKLRGPSGGKREVLRATKP